MITLNQLYTEERFKKMSVEELRDVLLSADVLPSTYLHLEPNIETFNNGLTKAKLLFERLHPMDNKIRLTEGMGVVNATPEQQKAIVTIAEVRGINIDPTAKERITGKTDGFFEANPNVVFFGHFIMRRCSGDIRTPVTFTQFIQAILNEPEKAYEKVVKLNDTWNIHITQNKAWLYCDNHPVSENPDFPLPKIDELAAAKKEVSQ